MVGGDVSGLGGRIGRAEHVSIRERVGVGGEVGGEGGGVVGVEEWTDVVWVCGKGVEAEGGGRGSGAVWASCGPASGRSVPEGESCGAGVGGGEGGAEGEERRRVHGEQCGEGRVK